VGGLINSIFGGNSNKYANKAIDFTKQVYDQNNALAQPWDTAGLNSYNMYNSMLGGPGQDQAFQNWLGSSDYGFTTKAGLDAINQNMASKGLLNSGSTLKAITQFGQDNAQKYRDNYMNQVLSSSQLGAGVLQSLMGSNQQSAQAQSANYQNKAQSQANGVGNFMNFGLGIASLIPGISDERLKTDIRRVGRMDKRKGGLPVYTYRFKDDPPNVRRMGVMAHEVADKRPDALGPRVANFMTVDYGKLAHA
jgi:hypothetical protein